MKVLLSMTAMLLLSTTLTIAQIVHTNVIKRSTTRSNNYGVNYFLPKSMIEIQIFSSKIEEKAGPYYKYAEKYLGTSNIVVDNKTYYELDGIQISVKGVPDKDKSYLVELKSRTTAPFVYLTESGLICTINAEYTPPENNPVIHEKPVVASNPKLSPETLFTEEYLQAGSTAKMAEIAAKQIYKIRESRMDILTGNSDNTPRDGAAMKLVLEQLEAKEKALVELFAGTSNRSAVKTVTFEIEPNNEMDKEVIFRFSKHLGVVGTEDLSGQPVYMNLKKIEKENLEDLETVNTKKKDKNSDKGVVYNIPGQGYIEIFYGTNKIISKTFDITQFGTTEVLANPIFEDRKAPVKVYFYPETGGIRKIEQ